MKKRCLSILLALCMVIGMVPSLGIPAAAAGTGPMELTKVDDSGSGQGFMYYNFVETTQFVPGTEYAFLDGIYDQTDAVTQLGSGAVLEATSESNNCTKYIERVYGSTTVATYVKVVTKGKGFDNCPKGGLYQVPSTENPTQYRYFCWAGGAKNCGPLYAYTYQTAEITWDNVTVYLNDPGNTNSSNSADYTVDLTYGENKTVTLDSRSYTVQCSGKTATVAITDNDGNTIQGQVTLPGAVIYQPGGLNVSGMPANQGIQLGGSVQVANERPSRTGGYEFQYWEDINGTQYQPGAALNYKQNGYTLTAVWKDTQAPTFECDPVTVTTGTTGEVVQNSIKAALKITDNESLTGCTVTVNADDTTAQSRATKQVPVTVRDAAGNQTTQDVTLNVLPGPLAFTAPSYSGSTLSVTLREPGPDEITETGIVWGVISSPTTSVNNGKYKTDNPVTMPDTSISTTVELAQGVTYYARAYAVVDGVTYYGPEATVGENIPKYGVFTIQNNGNSTFTVRRTGGTDGEQTVYYRPVNGSAVGGTHFEHQSSTVTIPAGQSSATITITEHDVNTPYGMNTATGYSNASRTYSVEIYRVDGGAVIEGNRDVATRTMTGNTTVDRNNFIEQTQSGDTSEKERGDYDKDGNLGWTDDARGSQQDHISVQPDDSIRSYVQAVSSEIQFYVTFEAKEEEKGYQAVQIVPGSQTDIGVYPYDSGNDKLKGSYSESTLFGYTGLFEHGGTTNDDSWASYRFPVNAASGTEIATTGNSNKSKLTQEKWMGPATKNYIAFPVATEQVTVSYGACGDDGDTWYTQNVVYHYQFIDNTEPTLLAIGDMGDSTYRVGDSFTVSLIFDEIVDSTNSGNLSGSTISTSWGPATYAGGGDTNVLYFTGTVPANAPGTLTVTGINATIKDMAGKAMTVPVNVSTEATVDTRTPSFNLSDGSISGGVGQATISNANENTTSLRYAWSNSTAMPATGWIPLTDTELEQANTSTGFTAMTRQESGTWYLHVLGVCEGNGALTYKHTSVNFTTGGSSGSTELVQPPTISVSVDNTSWVKSRTINVTYANGTAEYRYGDGQWQTVTGNSVTVDQNGTYAFRCKSNSGEAVTDTAEVSKIDTTAPTASIGAMTANKPTQKNSVYHSITLPVSYTDAQSGVQTVQYAWSSSLTAPTDGWTAVGSAAELTYDSSENDETGIYLHLKVTDKVGNETAVTSPAYQVISPEGAKAYAPNVTIDLADPILWDGTTWTNETQTLMWELEGAHTDNCVVTLPDGRTTTDTSGTILVSNNGTYTVSVVDNTYGGSNTASFLIDKIDTTAPTVTHDWTPEGWQSSEVTVTFTFADQGGSGLDTAKYAVVTDKTVTPTELASFSSNSGGSVTVSQDGESYIYYEVTDNTAGTYGDGSPRPANTTSGFVGPIQINQNPPDLTVIGGDTGASSLTLTVTAKHSSGVTVAHGGNTEDVTGSTYNVTQPGKYTFTAISNAGLTTTKEVQVYSIAFNSDGGSQVDSQLVVKDGKATQPAAPQKTGYTFGEWMNEQTAWEFDDPVTGDLTLTAKWTLNTPTATLEANKTSATYGDPITLTAKTNYVKGDDVTVSYAWYKDGTLLNGETGDTLTLTNVADSGSYKVKITAEGDGQSQTSDSNDVTVDIAPLKVELSWNYTDPITYDGQEHTVTAAVNNTVGDDTITLDYDGTREAVNVGHYEVTVTGVGSENYTLEGVTNTTQAWQIVPASGSASVTMADWTYGETASRPAPVSATHGTTNVTYHYTGTTAGGVQYDSPEIPTDAGDYTVTATFAATENYNEVTVQDTFTIAPRPVELTWSGKTNIPYDGQEHTVTPSIGNLVQGDICDLTCEESQKTNAGTYTAKVTALSNPNYTLEGGINTTLEWQITPIVGTASVTMEGWTYDGTAKNSPVPVSETNTGVVTYHYTGRNGTNYNSADVPTDAGDYTVTATFAATTNYEEARAQADFTIAKKDVIAAWLGLDQVYDDTTRVQVTLSGLVSGDDVAVLVDGDEQTAAGSYPLTATLTGADTANYTLKNNKATLTIQQKPVIFAVINNAVQADGSVKHAEVAADDNECTYTVTYQQNGKEVASPKEAGSYEIWVKITNPNYRHTDGSALMQVGVLTITQAPPVVYTVSFAGGEDVTGTAPAQQTATANGQINLPVNPFAKEHYRFTGWKADSDGKTYQPGDRFSMPARDVTFTAQWQEVFTVSGTIWEKTDGKDVHAENGVVSLWLGANKIAETKTKEYGTYNFTNLIPGIYNLVVTKDVRTVTSKVELTENKTCDATLPKGATNSIVEVTPGSPDIVVGNLDTVFKETDTTVYTAADQTTVSEGGKVEITFTADEKQRDDTAISDDMAMIAEKADDITVGLVMDYTLEKEVFDADGKKIENDSKKISQSNVLLEVLLPLPTELQGKDSYSVYRVHSSTGDEADKQVQELKQGENNKNELGEYFTVRSDKTGLTLYVKCFSTYAIGYTEFTATPSGGSSGSSGSSEPSYPPIIQPTEHGSVTIKPSSPQKGDTVTITTTPEDGYAVDTVTVTDPNGQTVEVTPNDDGTYTFVQPAGKVTITVTFQQRNETSDCPRDESCPMAPFTDADRSVWYHDGVHYCVEHGLMAGTSKTTFSPNSATTRGMIVTILWRLEGSPIVSDSIDYNDVPPQDWYGEAVRWADSAGVATGYGNGTFGPNDPITREQMATMLWRYAGSPKVNGSLSSFVDGEQTSDWAQSAMIWVVDQGLIAGVGNDRLEPREQATRAQAATILMRFAQDMAQ